MKNKKYIILKTKQNKQTLCKVKFETFCFDGTFLNEKKNG